MKILKRITRMLGILILTYFGIAIGLIFSQNLTGFSSTEGLDFTAQAVAPKTKPLTVSSYKTRDGTTHALRDVAAQAANKPLIVLVHGSGWYGQQFDELAGRLSAFAHVLVPDLRGHGPDTKTRGDVAYIGQMEDDLADLIKLHQKPGQSVIMAGHSSGGGLVTRFAGGTHGEMLDGAILMAPFLQYDAPSTRPDAGNWAKVLLRRIIGLSMLNAVNIRVFNHLPVIEFNFPPVVLDSPLSAGATTKYSFRLNTGFAPRRDYTSDIKALPQFLLIAGSVDETFFADEFEPLLSQHNKGGTYLIVPDVNHLDIVNNDAAFAAITDFLGRFSGASE